jgi:hypothetical protein
MNPPNGALPGRVIVGLGYLPHGALKVYIDANDLNRFIVIDEPPGTSEGAAAVGRRNAASNHPRPTAIPGAPRGELVQRGPSREPINTRFALTALSRNYPGQGAGFSAFEGFPLCVGQSATDSAF